MREKDPSKTLRPQGEQDQSSLQRIRRVVSPRQRTRPADPSAEGPSPASMKKPLVRSTGSRPQNQPVIARRSTTTASSRAQAPSRAARARSMTGAPTGGKAVYVALNTPGAEIRLPALPQIQAGWRLLSGILAVVLLFAIIAMSNLSLFQVSEAILAGAERLTADDINHELRVGGKASYLIKPAEIEQQMLEGFPDLASVRVEISLPARLTIQVIERQPVLTWKQGNTILWVDQEGFSFPVRGSEGVVELVQVEANGAPPAASSTEAKDAGQETAPPKIWQPKAFARTDLVTAIQNLGKQAPPGTPILYSPDYGLGWNDPQGWQVFFGSQTSEISEKMTEYQGIVDYLTRHNIHPRLISVEFPHAPFYRLEP